MSQPAITTRLENVEYDNFLDYMIGGFIFTVKRPNLFWFLIFVVVNSTIRFGALYAVVYVATKAFLAATGQ